MNKRIYGSAPDYKIENRELRRAAFPILTSGSDPAGIVTGPDGNLWFAEFFGNKIGQMSPAGVLLHEFPILTANGNPQGITVGPDGNLWFTEAQGGKIGQITVSGVVAEFSLSAGSRPQEIITGPDGALWFTDAGGNSIGRIDTSGTLTGTFAIPTATGATVFTRRSRPRKASPSPWPPSTPRSSCFRGISGFTRS